MAVYTDTLGFDKGGSSPPFGSLHKVYRYEVNLDFAKITAARAASGATALVSGDILDVLPIPAKALVTHVGVDVTTVGTSGLTLDIGDVDDRDGYVDGFAGDAVASTASVLTLDTGAVVGLTGGKYYSSAGAVSLTLVGQPPGGLVCRVWAVVTTGA
jgi:hypothetical protein